MKKKVLRERYYKVGYVVRDEMWDNGCGGEQLMERQAYNPAGEWIGSSKEAYRFIVKRGIFPIKADPSHCVCSIGHCPKEQKWYGWSHRALQGFGIGDKLFDEHWTGGHSEEELDHMPFIERGDRTIENMIEARIAATNFAESVS